ncbi:MAG TPA: CHAD domain-containing protein [Polyangiaceae bacterium]|nr:CHAD domain-containing protein [Polyangiaceae bacterium]
MPEPSPIPRFEPSASTWTEVRRLATVELDAALARLRLDSADELGLVVHETRKSIKRLRALLRLVERPLRRAYHELDGELRGVAQNLASSREAGAALEALNALAERAVEERRHAYDRARLALSLHGPRPTVVRGLLVDARTRLGKVRERILAWPELASGFELLERGYRRSYRRCRRTLRRALGRGRLEDFHELRKAIKAHQHQLNYLSALDTAEFDARRATTAALSQMLGDHHDLGLLAHQLEEFGFDELAREAETRAAAWERDIVEEATVYLMPRSRVVSDELARVWPGR